MKLDRGPLYGASAWASFLVPLAFALSRIDGAERWDQDVSVIRALDLVHLGGEGVLSASLSAGLSLLPIGSVLMRLSLLSAFAVGAAGWVTFQLSYRLLRPSGARPLLALCGALVSVLAASWQTSAVTVGGPALSAALALWWTRRVAAHQVTGSLRLWVGHGAFEALILLESRSLGLLSLLPLVLRCAVALELPTLREMGVFVLTATAVWALGSVPALLDTGAAGLSFAPDVQLPTQAAYVASPLEELGPYLLGLAVAGAVFNAWTPERRLGALLLVGWGAVGLLVPTPVPHLVATAALGACSSAGLVGIWSGLRLAKLPAQQHVVRIGGFVHLCALLLLVEGAEHQASQRTLSATRQWSEQAFARLPQNSLLIVSSPEAAIRLWSARMTSGIRPDVVLVPSSLLSRQRWAADLLAMEPRLAALIRDVAAQGVPGEYALAELADARPLRVEVDAQWDERLLRHLTADGLWFRFAPHATGRTDRHRAQQSVRRAVRQVHVAAESGRGRDVRTLSRLRSDVGRQAAVAALLGDRRDAERLLRTLRRLGADDAELLPLEQVLSGDGDTSAARLLAKLQP